jgi:hypothetical protein
MDTTTTSERPEEHPSRLGQIAHHEHALLEAVEKAKAQAADLLAGAHADAASYIERSTGELEAEIARRRSEAADQRAQLRTEYLERAEEAVQKRCREARTRLDEASAALVRMAIPVAREDRAQ